MLSHWINELMNLLAGNSRYVQYTARQQVRFMLGVLFFLLVTYLFAYSYYSR